MPSHSHCPECSQDALVGRDAPFYRTIKSQCYMGKEEAAEWVID